MVVGSVLRAALAMLVLAGTSLVRAQGYPILQQPETRQRLLAIGIEPPIASGRELSEFLAPGRTKWGEVIRSAGIKAD